MKEILDTVVLILFVLFVVFLVNGFVRQTQDKDAKRKKKNKD